MDILRRAASGAATQGAWNYELEIDARGVGLDCRRRRRSESRGRRHRGNAGGDSDLHMDRGLCRYPGRLRLGKSRRRRDLFAIDDLNGGLFGGYVGYNWQSDAWVFGAEADFNGVWNDQNFAGPFPTSVDIGTDWLASIRAVSATQPIARLSLRRPA